MESSFQADIASSGNLFEFKPVSILEIPKDSIHQYDDDSEFYDSSYLHTASYPRVPSYPYVPSYPREALNQHETTDTHEASESDPILIMVQGGLMTVERFREFCKEKLTATGRILLDQNSSSSEDTLSTELPEIRRKYDQDDNSEEITYQPRPSAKQISRRSSRHIDTPQYSTESKNPLPPNTNEPEIGVVQQTKMSVSSTTSIQDLNRAPTNQYVSPQSLEENDAKVSNIADNNLPFVVQPSEEFKKPKSVPEGQTGAQQSYFSYFLNRFVRSPKLEKSAYVPHVVNVALDDEASIEFVQVNNDPMLDLMGQRVRHISPDSKLTLIDSYHALTDEDSNLETTFTLETTSMDGTPASKDDPPVFLEQSIDAENQSDCTNARVFQNSILSSTNGISDSPNLKNVEPEEKFIVNSANLSSYKSTKQLIKNLGQYSLSEDKAEIIPTNSSICASMNNANNPESINSYSSAPTAVSESANGPRATETFPIAINSHLHSFAENIVSEPTESPVTQDASFNGEENRVTPNITDERLHISNVQRSEPSNPNQVQETEVENAPDLENIEFQNTKRLIQSLQTSENVESIVAPVSIPIPILENQLFQPDVPEAEAIYVDRQVNVAESNVAVETESKAMDPVVRESKILQIETEMPVPIVLVVQPNISKPEMETPVDVVVVAEPRVLEPSVEMPVSVTVVEPVKLETSVGLLVDAVKVAVEPENLPEIVVLVFETRLGRTRVVHKTCPDDPENPGAALLPYVPPPRPATPLPDRVMEMYYALHPEKPRPKPVQRARPYQGKKLKSTEDRMRALKSLMPIPEDYTLQQALKKLDTEYGRLAYWTFLKYCL